MNLKNKVMVLVSVLMISTMAFTGLTGCQQQGTNSSAVTTQKEPAEQVTAVADNLSKNIEFKDQMTEMTGENARDVYLLNENDVSEGKVYVSTGATAEEIAVWYAASPEKVEIVKKALEERVEFQRTSFEDYNAQELTKLKDPVLETKGQYVILCISDDNDKAKAIIDEAFK